MARCPGRSRSPSPRAAPPPEPPCVPARAASCPKASRRPTATSSSTSPTAIRSPRRTCCAVDAVEIKIGQSAKPGLGGHLPGSKVTAEIAAVRGFPEGSDIISPAHFPRHHQRRRTQSQGRRAARGHRRQTHRDQARRRPHRGRSRDRPRRGTRLRHHRRPGRRHRRRPQGGQGRDRHPDHLRPRQGARLS